MIALVGPFWWPCAGLPQFAALRRVERPLMLAGEVAGRPWAVGWHPGGAHRRHYPPVRYTSLIVSSLQRGVRAVPPFPEFNLGDSAVSLDHALTLDADFEDAERRERQAQAEKPEQS